LKRAANIAKRKRPTSVPKDYRRASIPDLKNIEYPPPESQIRQAADVDALNVARMKAKQGRLAEAEVDARGVLLSRLKEQGNTSPDDKIRHRLASVLVEQGDMSMRKSWFGPRSKFSARSASR